MSQPPARILIAVNPTASFGARPGAGEEARRAFAAAGRTVVVLTAPDAAALEASVRSEIALDRPAALVVVGGDGMVHLGVGVIAGTDVPLGIVPSGTGNDFARGLGIPLGDVVGAVRLILDALTGGGRLVDAGRVSGEALDAPRWFAGVLSAGFDAVVNERANSLRRPRGASRYVVALARELVGLRARDYRLEIDGRSEERSAMLVSVANNVSLGGGMRIAPDALLDDGLLDLFVVAPLGRLAFLRVFPSVFRGQHTGLDVVSLERVRRVRIAGPDVVAYADGERVGPLPLEVEIVPGALRILV